MTLLGRWNFSQSDQPVDARKQDVTKNWAPLELHGGATFTEQGLKLGKGAWARAVPAQGKTVDVPEEKTLIAWVILDDVSDKRPGGAAITVDATSKDEFDGIVFGESNDLQWLPGSTHHHRTDTSAERKLVESKPGDLVKMAITYSKGGSKPQIALYKNDQFIKSYQTDKLVSWPSTDLEVLFGVRHTHDGNKGYFPGTIVAAEIHGAALSKSEIAGRMANPSELHVVSVANGHSGSSPSGQAEAHDIMGTPVIELLLDASGSMETGKLASGETYIAAAKQALAALIDEHLPVNSEVALRVFGAEGRPQTELVVPVGPLNKDDLKSTINAVKASGGTAIADSLAQVSADLGSEDGPKVVVLMSDGEETVRGRGEVGAAAVEEELKNLKEAKVDVRISIIGINVSPALAARFQKWAQESGGIYVDAKSREDMSAALKRTTSVYYDVEKRWKVGNYPAKLRVANGVVDGSPVKVEADHYTVVFKLNPEMELPVTVDEGGDNRLVIHRILDN